MSFDAYLILLLSTGVIYLWKEDWITDDEAFASLLVSVALLLNL